MTGGKRTEHVSLVLVGPENGACNEGVWTPLIELQRTAELSNRRPADKFCFAPLIVTLSEFLFNFVQK